MKTLLLIRHAKSSWEQSEIPDFDRPLNNRGIKNCALMAGRMKNKRVDIDLFVSSPAERAKSTALLFQKNLDKEQAPLDLAPELYAAEPKAFFTTVSQLSDTHSCVALFSHNPGITSFVNLLTEARIDKMPTCSIFALRVDTDYWKEFTSAAKTFLFFDFPKATLST